MNFPETYFILFLHIATYAKVGACSSGDTGLDADAFMKAETLTADLVTYLDAK